MESPTPPGLVFSSDDEPGIRRIRAGRGFTYRHSDGSPVRDAATLARIRSLVIPPAYTDVWICADPKGHLQATGLDVRGRRQYRYHPRWREVRDAAKFAKMAEFGRALPVIRRRVTRDLGERGLTKRKVVAGVVRLLDRTLARVGNDRYAKENGSFGLTTLRKRHARARGDKVVLEFRGKSGRLHASELRDPRVARLVRSCAELPGHRLFQYVDDAGQRHAVGSADVNAYLQEVAGEDFTAKDFRTWAATALAAGRLAAAARGLSQTAARRVVADCIREVARALANTPAVCRKCYVHPGVVTAYLDGRLPPECAGDAALRRLIRKLR
ncbi:MAG: DNA topoisomerase IB [Alphaproteobacteria bacterium]